MQPPVHQAVADLATGRDPRAKLLAACQDERFLLAAEPMRYLHPLNQHGQPEWIALEEVPMCCRCGDSTPRSCAAGATRSGRGS